MSTWREFEERGARWANICSAIPAFYCAYVVWDARHSGASTLMSAGFLISLAGFVLCVAIGLVLNVIRNPKPGIDQQANWKTKEHWRLRAESENEKSATLAERIKQIEADLSKSIAVNDQLETEKKKAFETIAELNSRLLPLTSLQMDAIRLARDLKAFQDTLLPFPEGDKGALYGKRMSAQEYLGDLIPNRREWIERTRHSYETEGFPGRVKSLANRAGAQGVYVRQLEQFATPEPFISSVISDAKGTAPKKPPTR